MHILVCVKQVPDTTEIKMDPKTNTLDRSSARAVINPYDAHAVEEAVRIKKRFGGKVSILSMGPEAAAEVIKKCIELGADEGYLLSDRAFAGSDTLSTSYILSRGIQRIMKKEPIDLIFCGKQAIDGDTAQVGPGIACRLFMPQLTYVQRIEDIDPKSHTIVLQRKIDSGYEVVKSKLPCLITVEKEMNELTFSPLEDMMRAARYHTTVWNIDDIEADKAQIGLKGSPTSVRKVFPPPERQGGKRILGNAAEAAEKLAELLKEGIIEWSMQ